MATKAQVDQITDLLQRTGAAHGKYETEELNGVYDDDWPIWYAQWAVDHGLNDLLPQSYDAQRLSEVLNTLNEEHKQTDRSKSWAEFTAEKLAAMGA